VDLAFQGCVLDGVTLDGDLRLVATNVAGTVGVAPYTLEVDATLQDLSVDGLVLDGGFLHEYVAAGTGAWSTLVRGTSLDVSGGGATRAWSDFQFERGGDPGSGAYSFEVDATVHSSELGGEVVFDTRIAFTGVGASNPSAGRLDVIAPNGTRVRLDVLDAVNVQVRVDTDGDGGFEVTIDTTWAALAAL
jgi:hypothetical protein